MRRSDSSATLIDGGNMLVKKSGSRLSIAFNYTSNGQPVAIEQFEGAISFQNKQQYPPREPNPDPRVATSVIAEYYGKANTANAEGGLFIMALGVNDLNNGFANAEALQINGFMPLQEDHNALVIPDGTYEIVNNSAAMTPL